ncbi:MAG: response regulator [Rheinheimera sp.]|nr:response regulator [Rheinheimera sp.]
MTETAQGRLVVSDVQMPGISGLDLMKSIKLNYPQIPVLMMTAYATVNDAVQAIRLGAVDYLAKPFSPQVLVNMVGRYLPPDDIETHLNLLLQHQAARSWLNWRLRLLALMLP